MLTIYRSDVTGAVNEIQEFTKGSWIHLVNPTKDEADQVIVATKIPEDFIYDPLDVEEKPRFEKDEEGLLMIVDVPYIEEESSGRRYNTIPLGIIVTSRHFITVCSQQLDVLTLFSSGKLRGFGRIIDRDSYSRFSTKSVPRIYVSCVKSIVAWTNSRKSYNVRCEIKKSFN
ncbi:hypothetical protein OVA29_14950 [Exiguobacterium sp. SL14]|nr:CorA family divalent cation transporter [Exiguobacterium sp. SL14]MCY1691804.1 hypothetical protein [Exiguobacterium sp. SL14]